MRLRPLDDRIIVRSDLPEERTVAGLIIPDVAQEKPQQGTVLAVGPGKHYENVAGRIPVGVSVGEKIIFSKYGGSEVTIDGEDLMILTSKDVLAVVDGEA